MLAVSGYFLGVISLAIAMVLGFTPAATSFGQAAISCPLSAGNIVNISDGPFIRSDRSVSHAQIGPLSFSAPAGTYGITLVSYDSHFDDTHPDQPLEQWVLILQDSSGVEITRSQPIADLPGADDWLTQQTNGNLVVSRDIASVVAYHSAYYNDNPNSIVPVCASLAAVQVDPTATPVPPTNTPVPPTNTHHAGTTNKYTSTSDGNAGSTGSNSNFSATNKRAANFSSSNKRSTHRCPSTSAYQSCRADPSYGDRFWWLAIYDAGTFQRLGNCIPWLWSADAWCVAALRQRKIINH
jgi:hypothetical protein